MKWMIFYPFFISMLSSFADAGSEPPEVLAIRKHVQRIEKQLDDRSKINTGEVCEGDGCSETTVWIDSKKRIRKVRSETSDGPAASAESESLLSEDYYDEKGDVLFQFNRTEHLSGDEKKWTKEERVYMSERKLMAWKSDDHWHNAAEKEWLNTEIGGKSAGDAMLAEARQIIRKKQGVGRP